MKVADNAAKSAVLGYVKAEEMTVANTPQFINVLSSTLYKYQLLAVVRETLANAWDAHIAAKIDRPIQVDLDNTSLKITDFGSGIASKDMVRIYGTYGLGTKENDSESTGGFGLGCKSPFAYVDAFEVISCHEGTKTIYQIAKTGGTPKIVTIGSMPTEESGLQVNIPIKQGDYNEFYKLAKNIIRGGDIPCVLNGELVETIGLGREAGSICIIKNDNKNVKLPNIKHNRHIIRYANMLYPMPDSIKIPECMSGAYGEQFIIQAKANSLSVQPSREGLAETENTLDEITILVQSVKDKYQHEYNTKYAQYRQDLENLLIQEMKKTAAADPWETYFTLTPEWESKYTDEARYVRAYAGYVADNCYPIITSYDHWVRYKAIHEGHNNKMELQLKGAATPQDSGLDRGVCSIYYKHLVKYGSYTIEVSNLIYKLYRKLYVSDAPKAQLFVKFGNEVRPVNSTRFLEASTYAKREVYLTTVKQGEGIPPDALIYYIKRTNKNIAQAREFLATTGYTIIDMIVDTTKERKPKAVPVNSVKTLKSNKGLVSLDSIDPTGSSFNYVKAVFEGTNTIYLDKPQYIVMATRKNHILVPEFPIARRLFELLKTELRDKVAIAFSKVEYEKYKAHTVPLGQILLEVLQDLWNPIKDDYKASHKNLLKSITASTDFIQKIHDIPEFHDLLSYVPSKGVDPNHRYTLSKMRSIFEYMDNYSHSIKHKFSDDFPENITNQIKDLYKETQVEPSFSPEMETFIQQTQLFFREVCDIDLIDRGGLKDKCKPILESIIKQIRSMPV